MPELARQQSRSRLLRFVLVGLASASIQLAALSLLLGLHVHPPLANIAAFVTAAQCNFALNHAFTWSDRSDDRLLTRWMTFLLAISGTALLNLGVFQGMRLFIPDIPAAACGIATAAAANFLAADRAVFRERQASRVNALAAGSTLGAPAAALHSPTTSEETP